MSVRRPYTVDGNVIQGPSLNTGWEGTNEEVDEICEMLNEAFAEGVRQQKEYYAIYQGRASTRD